MAYINVTVYDSTENKRVPAELPDDALCNKIMAVLVQKLQLPMHGPDGAPLSYKFHHKNSGRQIQDSQTLAAAGVHDGDILRLQPEITAGAAMNPATIKLDVDPVEETEDRYSRLRLIPWWDQQKISCARVLVVGAGALGNEILKNLALLGFQNVVVIDLDRIEPSNLSRAILFRASDVGNCKADVVARQYRELLPEAEVQPLVANVMQDCGLGLFAWADLILAGLDNREARLWINRSAWKVHRPWIDGAIEGLNGVCRVFLPGTAPCYECTLGETDWVLLQQRMSCNLLLHEPQLQGRVATTPTISSIIAGMQVQEAVKWLHGLPTLAGKGYVFEGVGHTSYVVEYTEKPDCLSHYTLGKCIHLSSRSADLTLGQLFDRARLDLASSELTLEFSRDIVQKLVCPACNAEEEVFAPVGSIRYESGRCPEDGEMRIVHTLAGYSGQEDLAALPLDQLGLPLFDIFTARSAHGEISYLLAGDADLVLGRLATAGARL